MAMRNTQYPWFRWYEGAVPVFEKCTLSERGLLISLAAHYLKYSYTEPTDIADQLDLDPQDFASAWTPQAQRVWRFLKIYLEDERDVHDKARNERQARYEAARAKKKVNHE